jgi:hypothetical protein
MTAFRATSSAAVALAGAAAVGLVGGVATSYLQGSLPGGWNTLANSGAAWTVVAFVVALACSGARWVGVTAGALALVGEVAGYYAVASPLRDIPIALSERVLWMMAAMWVGPLAGLAGHFWRRGTQAQRVTSAVAMCGVVVGEGLHLLLRGSSPANGWSEIGLGGAAAVLAIGSSSAPRRARALSLGAGAVTAAGVYAVYGVTVL